MHHLLKSLAIASILTAFTVSAFAQNEKSSTDENVEISSQLQTTKEEIAAIQVLSEICPDIIGKNKNFDSGYQRILTDFLPGISNPVLAVQALSEEEDYQVILKQARQDAANASREENREVCLGVIEWNKKK